ncbi:hypothetical protein KSS87_015326 [Heliosperma pusillum]|nr:hypothetical protein KSS87_015326 [Heliosperma pusillum]
MGTDQQPSVLHDQELPTTASHQMGESAEITEECAPGQRRRPETLNLALEIPPISVQCSPEDSVKRNMLPVPSPVPKRVNFSPMHSPSVGRSNSSSTSTMFKNKSSFKNLLPKLSFKFKNASSDIEKDVIFALGSPSSVRGGRPHMTRTFSISRLFTSRGSKASSLPVTPISHSNPGSTHGSNIYSFMNLIHSWTCFVTNFIALQKGLTQLRMHRSRSVPLLIDKDGSIRQRDSLSGVYRVIPTPRAQEGDSIASRGSTTIIDGKEDDGEDIPEEEAVCRICFVELGEDSDTLKMECNCKGELALIHQECAIKWFSIKGNKICEVCKQEVKNLPVTLLRIQTAQSQGNAAQQAQVTGYRQVKDFCPHDILSFQLVSSQFIQFITYAAKKWIRNFYNLVLLLKFESLKNMGTNAIAVSIPFSCIMGLLASMMSTTMVKRRYIWIYAAIQFILVVALSHIFTSVVHILTVVSVIIATFIGFGATMCGCSLLCEIFHWWKAWRPHSVDRADVETGLPTTALESANVPQNISNQPEAHTPDPTAS